MSKLAQYINRHIIGNVFDSPTVISHYTTDRSILEYRPRLVAFPKNTTDLRKLIRFSHQLAAKGYELPVTLRGTGLDATGAAIGSGLLISTASLNRIEEIDLRGRLVRVQPGVTLGDLNQALSLHGLWLPVSYHPNATIGGLIANAPRDNLSQRYGGIAAAVERLEFVLSDGTVTELSPYSARSVRHLIQTTARRSATTTTEARLYRQLNQLLDRHADLVAADPRLSRIRTKHQWNLLPLIFGSQGTLGAITDIILHVELLPSTPRRLAAIFRDLSAALNFLSAVKPLTPRTTKLFDLRIFAQAAAHGVQPEFFGRSVPQGWLVQLSFDDRPFRTNRKLRRCQELLPASSRVLTETPETATAFTKLDSALLTYLNTDGDHSPIVPDVYLPPDRLPDFTAGLSLLEQTLSLNLPLYGSYLTNNYQVRPGFNYQELSGRQSAIAFLRQYLQLVTDCGGSVTGGSPAGRLKLAPSTTARPTDPNTKVTKSSAATAQPTVSPSDLSALAAAVKTTFDPYNIFNPDLQLGADLSQSLRHLRTHNHSGLVTP